MYTVCGVSIAFEACRILCDPFPALQAGKPMTVRVRRLDDGALTRVAPGAAFAVISGITWGGFSGTFPKANGRWRKRQRSHFASDQSAAP